MPAQELYCPKCSALIPEGQRVCPECGADLAEYDKEAEQEFQELLNAANKKLSEDSEEDNFEDIEEEAPAGNAATSAITQNQIDALLGGEVVDLTPEEEPPKKEKKKKKEKPAEENTAPQEAQAPVPAPAPAPQEAVPAPAAQEAAPAPAPAPEAAPEAPAEAAGEAPAKKAKKEKKPKPPKAPKAPKEPKAPKAPKAPKEKAAKAAGSKSAMPFIITLVAAVVAAALGFCIALFFFTDFMNTSEESFAISSANAVNSKLNMNERLCVYKAYVKNSSSAQECLLYAVIDYNGKASVTRYRVVVSKDEPNVINIYYPVDETSQAYIDMKNSSDPGTRVQASVLKNYSDLIEAADREISMGSDLWKEIDISRINSSITSEQSRNTGYNK